MKEKNYWIAEIAIPFKELNITAPKPGDIWGVNFACSCRGSECSQWSCTYGGNHTPEKFGQLIFRDNI